MKQLINNIFRVTLESVRHQSYFAIKFSHKRKEFDIPLTSK